MSHLISSFQWLLYPNVLFPHFTSWGRRGSETEAVCPGHPAREWWRGILTRSSLSNMPEPSGHQQPMRPPYPRREPASWCFVEVTCPWWLISYCSLEGKKILGGNGLINFMSQFWLGHRVPAYLVKLYSECFCEGIFERDDHLNGRVRRADCRSHCGGPHPIRWRPE